MPSECHLRSDGHTHRVTDCLPHQVSGQWGPRGSDPSLFYTPASAVKEMAVGLVGIDDALKDFIEDARMRARAEAEAIRVKAIMEAEAAAAAAALQVETP